MAYNPLLWTRFLLQYGLFMAIALPRDQAEQLVRDWAAGKLSDIYGNGIYEAVCHLTGSVMAVKVDTIISMHTYEIQTAEQQQAQGRALTERQGSGFLPQRPTR